jgi:hypothetical protein
LAVCKVLLEICLLCLFTVWKSLFRVIDSTEVLFTAPVYPSGALTFRMAFTSFSVTTDMS